jgi:peptidoglycan/LPS O-acetylase OafA/YrhL
VPSLDGLRAFSIAFVFIAHLSGTRGFVNWPFLYRFGAFCVRVFFVISGFLITTILLGEIHKTGRIALRRFYFRRTMRLFPACYVLIACTALLAVNGLVHLRRGDLLFAATYTMNYSNPRAWPLGHLWSLAIEEQFYLLWPAALMLLGLARCTKVLVGVLLVAPLIRLASPMLGTATAFLVWSDALASGCLLAMLQTDLLRNVWYSRLLSSRWFVFVPLTALAANAVPFTKISWLVCETIMNVTIAVSVHWAIRNPETAVGRVLNWPAICFIGVMSYSLYLWQQAFLNRESASAFCTFPVNVALTITAALLSYLVVEAPLLRLRMAIERWRQERTVRTQCP